MTTSLKSRVSSAFSAAAESYDQYSGVQKNGAKLLGERLDAIKSNLPEGPALEIGCGTGHLSYELFGRIPERKVIVTDLSPRMLETCRARFLNESDRAEWKVLDGESVVEESRYSLIASGYTFQWFEDLSRGLLGLVRALRPDGYLLFSVKAEGSFAEWESMCRKMDVPGSGNRLPDPSAIRECLSGVAEVEMEIRREVAKFSTAREFFKSLKKIGAATRTGGRENSPGEMRRLLRGWDAGPAKITYCSAFFTARKI